ncbi:response regulator transcription factor [Adlercreutzia equolifaciens]|uniref:response regulator transcription factor n=1 Tax=Adlercreutzia equolifaciens TaxID=446660 RepID=UPI0023B1C6F6|nr:LuxR C-terminal-related transcriptional regulator [Adlercreutzia equolifaciens]MCI9262592.1 response regulator transcription factor [Eggerthellaceae bacterium]MDE8702859.1 LuxR C-terminal-related transcriptional regulator [Adlercreutzia equolifaciens]
MIFVADPDCVLTVREQQILYHIAQGLSNREIAERLSLSEQTVKSHLAHMITKSGRANRAALVAYGFEQGILCRR